MPVVVTPLAAAHSGHKIPPAPHTPVIEGEWVPANQLVAVAGRDIPGGLFYRGTVLKTPAGANDPCLIDPTKTVSEQGQFIERQTSFWPSYVDLTPVARKTYLDWLASDRDSASADIGFVFLYFYGLERRVIFDGTQNSKAQEDWPDIEKELRRLLAVYSKKSANFRDAATELLQLVQLARHPEGLYKQSPPEFVRSWELPMALKLVLGQTAKDRVPLPAEWALAWLKTDPNTTLRTAAVRCPEPFARLFKMHYEVLHGAGFVLPTPNTKLKLAYRPASPVFRSLGEIQFTFDDTPNIAVLGTPLTKLKLIADMAADELDAYSRYVGRNPAAAETIDGLLHLPVAVWSSSLQTAMLSFKALATENGPHLTTMGGLLAPLGKTTAPTKDQAIALAKALLSLGVGMEPNVLYGAKVPSPAEPVALFISSETTDNMGSSVAFDQATLAIKLAAAFLQDTPESVTAAKHFLKEQVLQWSHLTPAHQVRVLATAALLVPDPNALKSLRKSLSSIDAAAHEPLLALLNGVLLVQGGATPKALQVLEKLYKVLGRDSEKVFSDVHAHSTSGKRLAVVTSAVTDDTPIALDLARVKQLQKESAEVSILLAGIFTEDASTELQLLPKQTELAPNPETSGINLLGLDSAHAEFAHRMLSQPTWSRDQLQVVANELDLMLEGALEQINDASFDAHDMSFIEGEDPFEVNPEIREIYQS